MKSTILKIFSVILGLTFILISISLSHSLWYTEDVQNGSGINALLIIFIGCALGLAVILLRFFHHNDNAMVFILIGPIAIFGVMSLYHSLLRDRKLLFEGREVYGLVTSIGDVKRGKTSGLEIRYNYLVEGKNYYKYSSNETLINDHNIKVEDSVIVRYWIKNPHYHQIKFKYKD